MTFGYSKRKTWFCVNYLGIYLYILLTYSTVLKIGAIIDYNMLRWIIFFVYIFNVSLHWVLDELEIDKNVIKIGDIKNVDREWFICRKFYLKLCYLL